MNAIVILFAVVASAAAAPAGPPYHAPAPILVAHAPAPYHAPLLHAAPIEYPPAPYAFQYGVADDLSHANFQAQEQADGKVTSGSYSVHLPDGRVQTVTYTADDYNGFVADVKYEGVAQYPVAKAPAYHAAPAPAYHAAPAPLLRVVPVHA